MINTGECTEAQKCPPKTRFLAQGNLGRCMTTSDLKELLLYIERPVGGATHGTKKCCFVWSFLAGSACWDASAVSAFDFRLCTCLPDSLLSGPEGHYILLY